MACLRRDPSEGCVEVKRALEKARLRRTPHRWPTLFVPVGMLLLAGMLPAAEQAGASPSVVVIAIEGSASLARAGTAEWRPARAQDELRPGDQFRTQARSRATLRFSDLSTLRLGELAHIQLPPPTARRGGLKLLRGLLYYFHRHKAGLMPIESPTAYAVVRGTEFIVDVSEDGTTRVTLLDGAVELGNEQGQLALQSGETAVVNPGRAPARSAPVHPTAVIQWVLYYPAVLDVSELQWQPENLPALADSLPAYRDGDFLAALAALPPDYRPTSPPESVYMAALWLTIGSVDRANLLLDGVLGTAPAPALEPAHSLAIAVRRLTQIVTDHDPVPAASPRYATEWLVESYARQARSELPNALEAARAAIAVSPNFAPAWTRAAELEFSLGQLPAARQSLARSLQLAPRQAQAQSLRGFMLAAANRPQQAEAAFDEAIRLDSGIGNAWLGRGLCRLRQGDSRGGREDLQVAATVEPQRALFRSYLAKAFAETGHAERAAHELELARALDPNDPTVWLYEALIDQRQNRLNAGVAALERSKELNEHRSLFRSRQLLDQDRAIRSANLAELYHDAGLLEVGEREASLAVENDYANASAHLFLANSFNARRDPDLVQLRYETPTIHEFLLANLLAPVGGTPLSSHVSQQDYARLFERNFLGLRSATEYRSDGSWAQAVSQYGVVDSLGYALDGTWRLSQGHRPNQDLEQFTAAGQVKVDVTSQDSVYFLINATELETGDVRQYYDEGDASSTLRVTERQHPNLAAGYHHAWSPGVHTLLLSARLTDTLLVEEPTALVRTLVQDTGGAVTGQVNAADSVFDLSYRNEFTAWTTELQQLVQTPHQLLVAGARYVGGDVTTRDELGRAPLLFPPIYTDPAAAQEIEATLMRASLYGYWQWQVADPWRLFAGVSYDWLRYPDNISSPPLRAGQAEQDGVSPKAGLRWTPRAATTVRAAYTRSLGGFLFEDSVRLEPAQFAGFIQAYRSLIPESLAGSIPGSRFETFHLGWQERLARQTYLVMEAERLRSEATREVGVFTYMDAPPFLAQPSTVRENLDFVENALAVSLHQLWGEEWAGGARYRVSEANLRTDIAAIPRALDPSAHRDESAWLHQLELFVTFQHRAGFFARGEALWRAQENRGDASGLPGDDFWQFNTWAGWRFAQRRVETAVGVLNWTGRNYHLNPLNQAGSLPRERTFVASVMLSF